MQQFSTTSYGYKEQTFFQIISLLVDLGKMPSNTLKSFSSFRFKYSQLEGVLDGKHNGMAYLPLNLIEALASIEKVKTKRKKSLTDYRKILSKGGYSKSIQEALIPILGKEGFPISVNNENYFSVLDNKKPTKDSISVGFKICLNNSTSSLPDILLTWIIDREASSYIQLKASSVANIRQGDKGVYSGVKAEVSAILALDYGEYLQSKDKFILWFTQNFGSEFDKIENVNDDGISVIGYNLFKMISSDVNGENTSASYAEFSLFPSSLPFTTKDQIILLTQTLRIYFNINFQNKLLEYSFNLKVSIMKEAVNALKLIIPKRGASNLLQEVVKKRGEINNSSRTELLSLYSSLNSLNWDAKDGLYEQLFNNNAFIAKSKTDLPTNKYDFSMFNSTFSNLMGFSISQNTRVPSNALFSLKYLKAEMPNYRWKIISELESDDKMRVQYFGVSEGFISVENTSKYFSSIKGNITPFGYWSTNNRYRQEEDVVAKIESSVVLANRFETPLNNSGYDKSVLDFEEFNLYDEEDYDSKLFFEKALNKSLRANKVRGNVFAINNYNSFHYLSRGYRASVARILATEPIRKEMVLKKLPSIEEKNLLIPHEILGKDYLGYYDKNPKPINERIGDDEDKSFRDFYGLMSVNFEDSPLSENTSYYFQDDYARQEDFPNELAYLSYDKFRETLDKYPYKKDGSNEYDLSKPFSQDKIMEDLEARAKRNLLVTYKNKIEGRKISKDPFLTAVTSLKKGDVVIVSSAYNNEMFGYLTPSFVFDNDYTKTPFFKDIALGVTILGANGDNQKNKYFRATPIDVCYAVVKEDMSSDFDVVSDMVNCSVVYEYKGKTIIEDWSLPLANLHSQSGIQTLNSADKVRNNQENIGEVLLDEQLMASETNLATFLSVAAKTSTINAFIRPAYTNIYSKEFTYYELNGYLMDYTNVAKEIGVIQRATLDYNPRLLNLENFKKEYNSMVKQDDVLKDITNKYFKGKEDTIVYKYLKANINLFVGLYPKNEKGIKEVFNALNSLAKYEAECYVEDEGSKPKTSKVEDLKSLIDNI